MASGHNDPKLLYAISGVSAFHIAHGKEESLTPTGGQTLSLLMVPTASPFAENPTINHVSDPVEEDFYLHLHLPPELDLALPATTQIYHQPPTSYLIPRWDLGPDSGAFTRLEFPALGSRLGVREDIDTFETILAQCTAFLERAPPPIAKDKKPGGNSAKSKTVMAAEEQVPIYNPGDFKAGEAYAQGSYSSKRGGGQIVLVNEEDGSVVGELGDGFEMVESNSLKPGSKDPVQILLPADGSNQIAIGPAKPEDIDIIMHPAYTKSTLVSNAAAASRLIVTTSGYVSKALQGGADSFTQKTKPVAKPVTFKPSTKEHVRRVHTLTSGVAGLSSKTVGSIGKVAQNLGATIGRHGNHNGPPKGFDQHGKPLDTFKPGLLNKSMIAFSTVVDGIEQAGRTLLESTSSAATTVVHHRWGPEAGEVSRSLGGGVKNVGLVYIDVTGVSRRAILKSVAKGMVIGRVAGGGGDIVVGDGGDGGETASGAGAGALPGAVLPAQQQMLRAGKSNGSETFSPSGVEGERPAYKY